MFGLRIGAATDVGVERAANEDSYSTSAGLVVAADGMGGHRGGEVASTIAVSAIIDGFTRPELELLVESVGIANKRILATASAEPALFGMGTTVVALALIDVDDGVALGAINVGDSRMYRLTGNVLEQLTEDHSLVEALVREGRITAEEAEEHPQRNIVTRALGVSDHVDVDSFHFIPKLGDRYLLCSDGLSDEVAAHSIAEILASTEDPQAAAEQLIAAANESGGRDNITAVIADIVEADAAEMPATPSALASEPPEAGETNADDVPEFDEPDPPPSARSSRWSWRR